MHTLLLRTTLAGGYHLLVGRDLGFYLPLERKFAWGLTAAVSFLFVVGVAGALLIRRQQVHQGYLARNTFQYNPHLQQILTSMTNFGAIRTDAQQAMQQAYGRIYVIVQQQAAVLAYIDVLWIMGGVCFAAIAILFFAKKSKPGQAAMAH